MKLATQSPIPVSYLLSFYYILLSLFFCFKIVLMYVYVCGMHACT